jgi:hypothetical protein
MNSISPAMAAAFRLLRTELYTHLDEAEFLALKYETWDTGDVEAARKVIADLVTVIRSLLAQHENTENTPESSCRCCGDRWPCPSVQVLHQMITDPEREFVRLTAN